MSKDINYPHLPEPPEGHYWQIFDWRYGDYGEVILSDVCLYRRRKWRFDKRVADIRSQHDPAAEAAAARHILRNL
jgi:hypothetical protein